MIDAGGTPAMWGGALRLQPKDGNIFECFAVVCGRVTLGAISKKPAIMNVSFSSRCMPAPFCVPPAQLRRWPLRSTASRKASRTHRGVRRHHLRSESFEVAKCRITAAAGRVRPNRDRAPWLVVAVPASGVGGGAKGKGCGKPHPYFTSPAWRSARLSSGAGSGPRSRPRRWRAKNNSRLERPAS